MIISGKFRYGNRIATQWFGQQWYILNRNRKVKSVEFHDENQKLTLTEDGVSQSFVPCIRWMLVRIFFKLYAGGSGVPYIFMFILALPWWYFWKLSERKDSHFRSKNVRFMINLIISSLELIHTCGRKLCIMHELPIRCSGWDVVDYCRKKFIKVQRRWSK